MSHSSARRGGRQVGRQKAKNNTLLIGGLVVIGAIILAVAVISLTGGASVGEKIADQGSGLHINSAADPLPVPYNSNPPTSGYHSGGDLAPWGVQTQPIDDKITVHNIEHGGVIVHYRQDLDKATVDQLTTLARELQQQSSCILMVPRPADKLDTPIAVTAWNWMLKLQSLDADAIRAFFRSHVGRGPERACRPAS